MLLVVMVDVLDVGGKGVVHRITHLLGWPLCDVVRDGSSSGDDLADDAIPAEAMPQPSLGDPMHG
jgi:hypothetical protein